MFRHKDSSRTLHWTFEFSVLCIVYPQKASFTIDWFQATNHHGSRCNHLQPCLSVSISKQYDTETISLELVWTAVGKKKLDELMIFEDSPRRLLCDDIARLTDTRREGKESRNTRPLKLAPAFSVICRTVALPRRDPALK